MDFFFFKYYYYIIIDIQNLNFKDLLSLGFIKSPGVFPSLFLIDELALYYSNNLIILNNLKKKKIYIYIYLYFNILILKC